MRCPKCGSEGCVKAGHNHGKQRYKCKGCGRQITQTEDKNGGRRALALYLYVVGLSMNAIARMVAVAPSTVLYWIRNFALKVYEKPEAHGVVTLELDEMWHFVGSKKQVVGMEGILPRYRRACGLGMWEPERGNLEENA